MGDTKGGAFDVPGELAREMLRRSAWWERSGANVSTI